MDEIVYVVEQCNNENGTDVIAIFAGDKLAEAKECAKENGGYYETYVRAWQLGGGRVGGMWVFGENGERYFE
jgi:hypothetical protein